MCKECLEHVTREDLGTSRPGVIGTLTEENLREMAEDHRRRQQELISRIVPPYKPPDIDPLGR